MIREREVTTGLLWVALIGALAVGAACLDEAADTDLGGIGVPLFEVDPLWPQPLPNHWILGSTIGVSVDSRDHV